MQAFAFHNPASVADAVRAAGTEDAKLIAGGQTLLQSMKLGLIAPSALVDISSIAELKGVCVDGDNIVIGAGTTHAAVAASPEVQQHIPALAHLAANIGDRQVRNRGTIGGSLANNDPAACYPAAVLALGASIKTDRRTLSAEDFFTGLYSTVLEDGEVITSVSFPVPEHAGWQKFKQPASRFSLVGVFVAKLKAGPASVRVAVTGAGASGVFRASELEAKLAANYSAAALAGATVSADALNSDLHGSAAYRAALIPVLAARAVG
jgi:carbon-monoxide dehydrogenase medium subunit